MNIFDVHALAYVIYALSQQEVSFLLLKLTGQGAARPVGEQLEKAKKALEFADKFFSIYEAGKCKRHIETARNQWNRPTLDVSAAVEIFHRLQFDIVSELKSKIFLRIAEDRGEFVDKDKLFGEQVTMAFGSASRDMREAGNCRLSAILQLFFI